MEKLEGQKEISSPKKEDGGYQLMLGLVMLNVPFLFGLMLKHSSAGFIETFVAYTQVAEVLMAIIGGLAVVALWVKRRWPHTFESPKDKPWYGCAAFGFGLIASIAIGFYRHDGEDGVLMFWPTLSFAFVIILLAEGVIHNVKRWWTVWRKP